MDRRKKDLVALAQREGLTDITVTVTGGSHYKVEGYKGKISVRLVAPCSSGDHRNLLNIRGNLRRMIRQAQEA